LGSIIEEFREKEPNRRVIVGGDFNMDKDELELDSTISPDSHLEKAGRKANYQTRKLTPFRVRMDLRFNTSLFRQLIMSNMRIVGVIYRISTAKDRTKVEI
jgi:starvation-inducible outer membrane lipoprotein